jgi:hypothetical protein
LSVAHGVITPVWASGIALSALLIFGRGLWPAVWLEAFLANATSGADAPSRRSLRRPAHPACSLHSAHAAKLRGACRAGNPGCVSRPRLRVLRRGSAERASNPLPSQEDRAPRGQDARLRAPCSPPALAPRRAYATRDGRPPACSGVARARRVARSRRSRPGPRGLANVATCLRRAGRERCVRLDPRRVELNGG